MCDEGARVQLAQRVPDTGTMLQLHDEHLHEAMQPGAEAGRHIGQEASKALRDQGSQRSRVRGRGQEKHVGDVTAMDPFQAVIDECKIREFATPLKSNHASPCILPSNSPNLCRR